MSDWNSDSDDYDPANELLYHACPDCNRPFLYLLTGCTLAHVKRIGTFYNCYTCADGSLNVEPCETFGIFNDKVICACEHGDVHVCTRCCSFTPSETYIMLTHIAGGHNPYILHTALSDAHANMTIATASRNDYYEWCPLNGGKIAKCTTPNCPHMLVDEGHDGQLCYYCRSHAICGAHNCLKDIQNSTIGRKLHACQRHIRSQFCIVCTAYFQSRGVKYRCRACNPNMLAECTSCRSMYNYGSVFMPIRMEEPKCLKCDTMNTSIHAIFASTMLDEFEDMVARLRKYTRAHVTHDAALIICAMTYESVHAGVTTRYKTSLACRNLREGVYAFDRMCALSCLIAMRRLPNDIRLKIIEMTLEHTRPHARPKAALMA